MKKIIRLVLLPAFALLLGAFWMGGSPKEVQAAERVTEITTADELAYYAKMGGDAQTYEGQTIRLMNNIDMSELTGEYKGEVIRFGSKDTPFKGTFDGNGYTISNLKNEKSVLPDTDLGLFAWTEGAVIKDLTLEDPVVDCAFRGGVLVGHAKNTTIENVRVHGGKLKIQPANNVVSLVTNAGFSGGAIAGSAEGSKLYNCEVRGTEVVNNSTQGVGALGGEGLYMGGIIGSATGGTVIEYCRVDDGRQLDGDGNYQMVESTVRNEYDVAVGALGGKAIYAGGIAGELKSGSKIIDSYSTAEVYAYCGTYVSVGAGNVAYAGGVVAEMYGGSCEVIRSHYAGNIHTEQYNALLVIPIIEKDKYISGVAQYSENEGENKGLTNSYFQRSASKTDKTFYALNDEPDTESYRSLTDEQYRDRSFWIGKGYDLYGTEERTGGAKDEAHYNKWVMDYTRGIPIHGNTVSAAIDFPGAGTATISGTELIRNSMEGYPEETDCSVTTDDANHFAVQGFDTYEGVSLSQKTNEAKDQTGAIHKDGFKFSGWYLKGDNHQDSVTDIKGEYADLTGNYNEANKVTLGEDGAIPDLKDNALYVAHYQANVIFHDMSGNQLSADNANAYYNYQDPLPEIAIDVPDGCQFYGWTDVPNKDTSGGYQGISNPDLTALQNGGNIYQAGDLIEKPLKLYPIFTDYKNNIQLIMEGNERDSIADISRRDNVAQTNVAEENGKVYLTLAGLDESNNDMGVGILPDGYRFLGWYEVVDEGEHRISTDMKFELRDVDFTVNHTYKARLEYRVQYSVKAFRSQVPPYNDENGMLYAELWETYGAEFEDLAAPSMYLEKVAHWGDDAFQQDCSSCEHYWGGVNREDNEIYDKLNVYSHNQYLGGMYDVAFFSDFPGAGAPDYEGNIIGGMTIKAQTNPNYNFTLWTQEHSEYDNRRKTSTEENWKCDSNGARGKMAFGAHYTANVTFHKENNEAAESQTVTRRYNEAILLQQDNTYEYNYELTGQDTGVTNTSAASPGADFTAKAGYHFVGWIDKTGLSEHELSYIYDVPGEDSCTSRASKALPYIIGTDTSDGRNIVKRSMDLYPVYVKEDITTTTNIAENGVPQGAGINVPTDPVYQLDDLGNGQWTLTLTAYDNKEFVVGSDGEKYRLKYVEMLTNPGTDQQKTERIELSEGSKGQNVYTFTLENFDLGPSYKFIAYYEPIAVLYHLEDDNIKTEVRNTGSLLGESPEPLYEEAEIDAENGGMYHFVGWTTERPQGTVHQYYLLNSYDEAKDIYLAKPTDKVNSFMELFPVYAPVNIQVISNIDDQLDDTAQQTRWIERTEDGAFAIHAKPSVTVGDTKYVFTGWKAGGEDFAREEVVTLDEVFDGIIYEAQYSKGYTINYHYWDQSGNDQILYTTGVTEEDHRTFVEKVENVKPDGSTETIQAPVDMEAFTGILNSLSTGQYFDEWQWVKGSGQNAEATSWSEFCNNEIVQDMELYPVIWQAKVYDGSNQEMSQVSSGGEGPEVYLQANLTKDAQTGQRPDEQKISVYLAGVYSQESLTVNVSRQNYENNGAFVGVKGIKAEVYNEYRLEEVPDPNDPQGTITQMTGDFMGEKDTDQDGNAVFTFDGELTISKKMEDGSDSGEPFRFTVTKLNAKGKPTDETTSLFVPAGESVTMRLPYGQYTVSEDEGWAWRFESALERKTHDAKEEIQGAGGEVYINSYKSSVCCTNKELNGKWFDHGTHTKNVFGSSNESGKDTK